VRVEVRTDREDGVDKALKKLKKKLFDDGRIKELNERRYFEKPSTKRRKKREEAMLRNSRRVEAEKRRRSPRGLSTHT